MKRCTGCKTEKSLERFSRASRSPDGLHWQCKDCRRAHYERTREQTLRKNREWREAHPGYFEQNYRLNRDRRLETNRDYYYAHRDELLEQMREYQRANLPKFRIYGRARTARKVGAPRVELVDRQRVYERFGGICGICGKSVPHTDFHVDHIVPLSAGGEHTYANTQLAHPVCNLRKGRAVVPEVSRGISCR